MEQKRGISGWVSGPRGQWITLIIWIMIVAVLNGVWPSVKSQEQNSAANLAADTPSVQATLVAEREFPSKAGTPALLVWKRAGGLTQEDLKDLQSLTKQWEASPLPDQTAVMPLHKLPLPALQAQLSNDKSTLVLPVLFSKEADVGQLKEAVAQLKQQAAAQFGSNPFGESVDSTEALSARVTGPVGISIDATGLFMNADVSLLIATVLLVLVILLLIYRSPMLALIPLIAVGFAYGAVGPMLGFMAQQGWITVDAQAISIMTVLLFGAGTDYCLFLVTHYRHLLAHVSDKRQALVQALKGSSGAIAMSGFTVVISLLVLLLAKYGAYYRFAIPFSLSILIMGIASLTLVPALLAIFGRASFYPFVPRTPEMEEDRAKHRGKPVRNKKANKSSGWIGRVVVTRPWTIIAITVLLLGGLAGLSTRIQYTYDILSSFPSTMESREGFKVIGDQFSEGELAPVNIMIDTEGKEVSLQNELDSLPYIDQVSAPQKGQNNEHMLAYSVELSLNPYSLEAMNHIPEIRAAAEAALLASGIDGVEQKVWIGGQTATQYDTEFVNDRDTIIVIPVVIGLIALLLLFYLRSIVATVYLIGTVVLSYFSALGLGWLILHYGFGVEAIQGAIPLYAFVFLVALGEDYNIFMVSRIWQKSKEMPIKQAIREGVNETSSVITSAGIILAGTFAVLATLPIQVLVQFGTVTALGVLLDTFIVRPFMVPAITAVLGRRAFWPGKLSRVEEQSAATD
ncbi:MMPL family transporter [Paenibacillus sp. ACRRX]|uniref:MMPL family transporter n=1 Tax=unclassified Paenibacillus TaxID=185978 RepID=UPI001EF3FE08|nr:MULTISPECIES: MMPL family transporter [unclassified Paenibacillus]MCG7410714.1 MMPL family transporter [Paenibacillus sp. ACRRX]MDK8184023.1 MMPL family transporter [Paenibacillus sp. UMB4589-SE434]